MKNSKSQKSKIAQIEEDVLKYWKDDNTFLKTLKKTKNGKPFIFYEGPPTANGRPGIHHVISRCFKDVFLRYKTMKGFYAQRRAGWDTHGLPVEIEAEKKLGIKSKPEIEKYGIEKFNKECKKSVWAYKDEWEKMTDRMGYWVDMKNPYITYSNQYMESLWWIIKQFSENGFLEEDHKILPFCTRCGTGLSSHELAQGYKTVRDRSVYVKFKFSFNNNKHKTKETPDEYFLVWTTTPWTLPSNVALAVNKDMLYARVKIDEEILIVAKNRVKDIFGDGVYILGYIKGEDLLGLKYQQLFNFITPKDSDDAFCVVSGDFVSDSDGTGIVHIAPAYGEDDMKVAKENNLPIIEAVKENGEFVKDVSLWQGIFVKDADPQIIKFLKEKGSLLKEELYEHEYPFCWRCKTPLLYFAKKSWFVKTSKIKDKLIKNNKSINWIPDYIKEGRFGEWLKDNKDWAFSRNRYWGTPLPVWRCEECKEYEVIGSVADIAKRSKFNNSYFLMRHGQAEFNKTDKIASSNKHKNDLTKKGILDVKRSAKSLKNIDLIITSPFQRTLSTANLVAEEIGLDKKNVIEDALLSEINVGVFDGLSANEYHAFFNNGKVPKTKKEYLSSLLNKFKKRPKGGESLSDLKKRVYRFLKKVDKKYKGKNILIVSHEYPLWMLESVFFGWSDEQASEKKAKMKSPDFIKTAEVKKIKAGKLPLDKNGNLDLHIPYIDEIKIKCKKCKKDIKRVSEVCDVWFDSGAMPFAQLHYPFENRKSIDKKEFFPADYICEAVDQTRGWFYTLLAVSTLLGFGAPYKNVISLGHILDNKGKKMSKSVGNVVNPWEMADKYGMDSVRWYFYIANSPGEPKRFNEKDLSNYHRKHIVALLNILNFIESYVDLKKRKKSGVSSKNILDKWIISRLKETIKNVSALMDKFDAQFASREIAEFVDDLTNWYIRRSRRRFQHKENGEDDYQSAKETLLFVFEELLKLTAPFTPFVAEHIWLRLGHKKSIHLEKYPEAKSIRADKNIIKKMKDVRMIVSDALKLRAKEGVKVRQPLSELTIKSKKIESSLVDILKEEVNVKSVSFDESISDNLILNTNITEDLRYEGMARDLIRAIQEERKALKLTKQDVVKIKFKNSNLIKEIVERFKEQIKSETVTDEFSFVNEVKNPKIAKLSLGDIEFSIYF